MPIKFTVQAEFDLTALYRDSLSRFGAAQADTYVAALEQTFEVIAAHPKLSRLRREYTPPVRIHHCRSHYIIYVEDGVDVLILRILYHASDLTLHLAKDNAD